MNKLSYLFLYMFNSDITFSIKLSVKEILYIHLRSEIISKSVCTHCIELQNHYFSQSMSCVLNEIKIRCFFVSRYFDLTPAFHEMSRLVDLRKLFQNFSYMHVFMRFLSVYCCWNVTNDKRMGLYFFQINY